MKVIIVGLGVQGYKRRAHARSDFVASVDPKYSEADYRDLRDVPLGHYDAVLACTPDEPKAALLRYCLSNGKHVLVEKPLLVENDAQIIELQDLARKNGLVCYTAYNHRFEPSFMRMRKLIESGVPFTPVECFMAMALPAWCATANGGTKAPASFPIWVPIYWTPAVFGSVQTYATFS